MNARISLAEKEGRHMLHERPLFYGIGGKQKICEVLIGGCHRK
jgi:hypothetical protein